MRFPSTAMVAVSEQPSESVPVNVKEVPDNGNRVVVEQVLQVRPVVGDQE